MNRDTLRKHIAAYKKDLAANSAAVSREISERSEMVSIYRGFDRARILKMTSEDLYEYLSPLWAMMIWGNKHYVVDKIIADNSLESVRHHLAELVWGTAKLADRWDTFRKSVKGIGPAMASELLCKSHPNEYMLWNRRAYVGLNYLCVPGLPQHNYQLTGAVYENLCNVCLGIAKEMHDAGVTDTTLLAVDYFVWEQLQVEDNLSKIHKKSPAEPRVTIDNDPSNFVHDEIRDKLRDIGIWLGFDASTEKKVSEGARVDTIWEATIGNMGRVIYIFEVQTKGSIDSLIVNLLKSMNNAAVQGVVAVSDAPQLDKIRAHAAGVKELRDKLRYWNYEDVLRVHQNLELVNEQINALDLVPRGF